MGIGLHNLRPPKGARHKKKRLGRGVGSGHGKTAGKGYNGQRSRAGADIRPGFEGGQMPLIRRLPKRGFHNPFRVEFSAVNLGEIARCFGAAKSIGPDELRKARLARGSAPIKVLGEGEIKHALTVTAHGFSKSALKKIEAAGGKVVTLPVHSPAK